MRPGLLLQKLTTREPELDQLEVAIASLRAVFTAEQRAEVDARAGLLVPSGRARGRDPATKWPSCRVTWTESELLADHEVVEPLVAGGVRCHGGFAADGAYVSPRTKYRVPAIDAWQQSHREQFGTEILDAPIELWPEVFPSVAQTKYLLREGVPRPTISSLDAHRHGRRLRFDDPRGAASTTSQSHFDESHRRHRDRAPAARAVRGARP